jgi:hypothetical protein
MLVSMMNAQYEGIRLTELLFSVVRCASAAIRQTCSFSHLGTTMTIKVCRHQDNVYKNSNEFEAIRLLSLELLTSNHWFHTNLFENVFLGWANGSSLKYTPRSFLLSSADGDHSGIVV